MGYIDITGQAFGRLTVVKYSHQSKNNKSCWECVCECGNSVIVRKDCLTTGNTESCGCLRKEEVSKRRNANRPDLAGGRFGRLLVIKPSEFRTTKGEFTWLCLCDCGNEVSIVGYALKSGKNTSCGCLRNEGNNYKHGQSKGGKQTAEYKAWHSMKERCYNPTYNGFENWGGRGIVVCPRWLENFQNFLDDMGKRPSPKHSLDRFPNNETGNYEPSNCRWATKKQQAANTRSNVWYECDGKKMIQIDWLKYLKVHDNTFRRLIRKHKDFGIVYNILKQK